MAEHGSMEEWQSSRLDKFATVITENINVEDLVFKLHLRNIISSEQESTILSDSLRVDEQRMKLVEVLKKVGGCRGYWNFCHLLRGNTFVYDILHKCEEGSMEKVENVCTVCSGDAGVENCRCCSGLVSVLSNPKYGVLVEQPEDILVAFQSLRTLKEKETKEVGRYKINLGKANQQIRELLDNQDNQLTQIQAKEKECIAKQKKIDEILEQSEKLKMENEKLGILNEDMRKQIKMLEGDVAASRAILRQIDVDKVHEDPIYENCKLHVESLEQDVRRKESQLHSIFQSKSESDSNATHYKLRSETLEELLQKQKDEHDRVFTLLQNRLKVAETDLAEKKEDITRHKDYLTVADSEKLEMTKQRDHLLRKVYEKNDQLKETEAVKKRIEQDKASLETLYSNQIADNNQLKKEYLIFEAKMNSMVQKLREEKDNLEGQVGRFHESSGRRSAVENDEGEVLASQEQAMRTNSIVKMKVMEEEIATLKRNLTRRSDKTIQLKKIGDKFGINCGMKKGPLQHGESRIIITSFSSNHLLTTNFNVEENDYVILVNNENVQDADIKTVRGLITKTTSNVLTLVIRKPARQVKTVKTVNLNHIIMDKFDDLGIRLAISVAVDKSSATRECGLLEKDELIKVNQKNCDSMSLSDISKFITKSVKQRQCDLTVNRYNMISDEEVKARQSIGLDVTQDDPANSLLGDDPTLSPGPRLPPRGLPGSREDLLSVNDSLEYTEDYVTGSYHRVKTKFFDSAGNLVQDNKSKEDPEKEMKVWSCEVMKESYETFGLHIIGGNKTGIFVEAVDNWKAAQKANIQVGWKLLQVNGLSMEKVAFCYANEVLQKFLNATKVTFKFEITPIEHYKKMMRKRPYDSFHVRALVDYVARDDTELSFKTDEILCVNDSYVMEKQNEPYRWQATKDDGTLTRSGLIPRQIGNRAPSAIAQHTYEEIDPLPEPSSQSPREKTFPLLLRGKKPMHGPDRYYKILDPVGEVLV